MCERERENERENFQYQSHASFQHIQTDRGLILEHRGQVFVVQNLHQLQDRLDEREGERESERARERESESERERKRKSAREREREATQHTHLLRERGGRAVCQRWGGACDILDVSDSSAGQAASLSGKCKLDLDVWPLFGPCALRPVMRRQFIKRTKNTGRRLLATSEAWLGTE